jgi:hypothetical protein
MIDLIIDVIYFIINFWKQNKIIIILNVFALIIGYFVGHFAN